MNLGFRDVASPLVLAGMLINHKHVGDRTDDKTNAIPPIENAAKVSNFRPLTAAAGQTTHWDGLRWRFGNNHPTGYPRRRADAVRTLALRQGGQRCSGGFVKTPNMHHWREARS